MCNLSEFRQLLLQKHRAVSSGRNFCRGSSVTKSKRNVTELGIRHVDSFSVGKILVRSIYINQISFDHLFYT
jgi:hypothetical protein